MSPRRMALVLLAVGAAGVLHQAEPAPAVLAVEAKVRPGHGKEHVQGRREHSKAPTRGHSKAPKRHLTKVQEKARQARIAHRSAKAHKSRHEKREGKTEIEGQYPPEKPELELEQQEEDDAQDEEGEQDREEKEEGQQERPLDLHATAGPAPLISSAVANSLGVDRATGSTANDDADRIRENSVANAIAANAAIAVAAADPVAAARRQAELQINAKVPSTPPLSWNPATGAPAWDPITKATEQTQEPPQLAFASSPISSAFGDLLKSYGADQRKETPSTLSAVQAIRNAVGGASATHITAEDEAAVAEAHVDYRDHPPMSDIEAGMPGLHGEKNPAQMLRYHNALQRKSAAAAIGSAALVSQWAKPTHQQPWDASKFMELAMSPAARKGRVKQDEFKELVNQVRSSVGAQEVVDPSFDALVDGSKQTAYQKLVTKMFSKVDEDAAAEAALPAASSAASPPPPDVSIDYPYPDVAAAQSEEPSASPSPSSPPPPGLQIDCFDCYPDKEEGNRTKGEEGGVQAETKEPAAQLEAERVVLADLDQQAWTGIPHLRANRTANATAPVPPEEAPFYVPTTKRLAGYADPKVDTSPYS